MENYIQGGVAGGSVLLKICHMALDGSHHKLPGVYFGAMDN